MHVLMSIKTFARSLFHFIFIKRNTNVKDWQPQSHLDNRRRIGYFQIKFAGYPFFFIGRNGGCYKNFLIIVHWYLATIRHHLDHSGQASLSQPNGKCVTKGIWPIVYRVPYISIWWSSLFTSGHVYSGIYLFYLLYIIK